MLDLRWSSYSNRRDRSKQAADRAANHGAALRRDFSDRLATGNEVVVVQGDDDICAVPGRRRLSGNLQEGITDLLYTRKKTLVIILRDLKSILILQVPKKRGAYRDKPDGTPILPGYVGVIAPDRHRGGHW